VERAFNPGHGEITKNFNAGIAEIYAKRAIKGRGHKEISLHSI